MALAALLLEELRTMSRPLPRQQGETSERVRLISASVMRVDTSEIADQEHESWMWTFEHNAQPTRFLRLLQRIRNVFKASTVSNHNTLLFRGPMRSRDAPEQRMYDEVLLDDLLKEETGKAVYERITTEYQEIIEQEIDSAKKRFEYIFFFSGTNPNMVSYELNRIIVNRWAKRFGTAWNAKTIGEFHVFMVPR